MLEFIYIAPHFGSPVMDKYVKFSYIENVMSCSLIVPL